MESNWRYAVADLGWVGDAYRLYARVLSGPFIGLQIRGTGEPIGTVQVGDTVFLDDRQVFIPEFAWANRRFPAGQEVTPDR